MKKNCGSFTSPSIQVAISTLLARTLFVTAQFSLVVFAAAAATAFVHAIVVDVDIVYHIVFLMVNSFQLCLPFSVE